MITRRWRRGSVAIASSMARRCSAISSRASGCASTWWAAHRGRRPVGEQFVLGRRGLECAERQAAPLAAHVVDGLVGHDPVQPGPQRRAPGEAWEVAQRTRPRVLHDLLGGRVAAHVAARGPQQRGVMQLDEVLEGGLVPPPQRRHQPRLVVRRRRTPGVLAVVHGGDHRAPGATDPQQSVTAPSAFLNARA